jgi:hypothetical protein
MVKRKNKKPIDWEFGLNSPWIKCFPLFWTPGTFNHSCCQAPVAHICNPSYSRGYVWEDSGLYEVRPGL